MNVKEVFAGGLIGGESAFSNTDFNFDPLGLAKKLPEELAWYREAELKHGRVAMMAFIGVIAQEGPRIPGLTFTEACAKAQNVVDAHAACVGNQWIGLGTKDNADGKFETFQMLTGKAELVGPMFFGLVFIGILELLTTFRKPVTLESAGDYQLGAQFMPSDPVKAKEMKLKELKNGRLAMMAFGGAITQATLTGHGFPWMYAERSKASSRGLSSSIEAPKAAMLGRPSHVARKAEDLGADDLLPYKMSKAIPFLPLSPALEGYAGGDEEGFDPMGISLSIDVRWLREAELKHGRVAMLATLGWIVTDLGVRLPGAAFQVSTVKAHNVMVLNQTMPHMIVWFGCAELFGFLAIIRMMEGETDRMPGDFGLRALYPTDAEGQRQMQLKELRNGRLAMLAIGALAGLGTMTLKTFPGFGLYALPPTVPGNVWVKPTPKPRSASLPFLPKPGNLQGLVGAEQEFDPIGFTDVFDVRWFRESEIKHGRVCMLACVGFLVTNVFVLPGAQLEPDSLKAFYAAPPQYWAVLLFLAGYAESSGYSGTPVGFGQQKVGKAGGISMLDMFNESSQREPGDFGFRALFPSDAEGQRQMKLKELNNGRLAMFALGGMVHHNLVTGAGLFPLIPDGWTGPYDTWKAESPMTLMQKLNPQDFM